MVKEFPEHGVVLSSKDKTVLSFFTNSGFYDAIQNMIKEVNIRIDEPDTFMIYTSDKRVNVLLKYFENFILDLKDGKITRSNCSSYFIRIKEIVDKNSLYIELSELAYLWYSRKAMYGDPLNQYDVCFSVLLEEAAYVFGNYMPLYVDESSGKIMVEESEASPLNYEDYLIVKRASTSYNSKDMEAASRIGALCVNNDIIVRQRLIMLHLIGSKDDFIWNSKIAGCSQIILDDIEWMSTSFYREHLNQRNRMIDIVGERYFIKNLPGYKEIQLKEKFYKDIGIITFFSLLNEHDECIIGIYNMQKMIFLSSVSDAQSSGWNIEKGRYFNEYVENFILEVYAFLTCSIVPEKKRLKAVKIYDSNDSYAASHVDSQICLVRDSEIRTSKRKQSDTAKHSYVGIQAIREIEPYIRDLPTGYKASDEAKENAKFYGFKLPENKTFVTGFEKTVYMKQNTSFK